jgi:hypothetical protein
MEQKWFEMPEERRRKLEGAVWIPLRASVRTDEVGVYGDRGYKSQFYGVGTLAIAADDREKAGKLDWMDVGISHCHTGGLERGEYVPCDVRVNYGDTPSGLYLALEQRGNRDDHAEWHLHQDFVITLKLKREGDTWVSLDEGYIEIARLKRRQDGSPNLLEVRASHLKDYLCARNMALYVSSYRERRAVLDDASHLTWPTNPILETNATDRWEGRVTAIHEGGMPYGEKMAVFHAARTDIDPTDDVPSMDALPTGENVKSASWTSGFKGEKLYSVMGALWRNEWIEPSSQSPIVRRDKVPATVFFVTDSTGKQETRDTLADSGRWLWFRPEVVLALVDRRGGSLGWYTRDTGSVGCAPGCEVHFGINPLGLVNVYAKDIALLPDWQQKVWAGHNVGPDGKVSDELLASQVSAEPARTQAPEKFLGKGLRQLNKLFIDNVKFPLIREHHEIPNLLRRAHRFRATDKVGLFSLAKDLARLTADSFDASAIQKHVQAGTKGSLKSLEMLLATQIDPQDARKILGPLFGIYELRHADAHLPSREIDEALKLAKVDQQLPYVTQGYQLLCACVDVIYTMIEIAKEWNVRR